MIHGNDRHVTHCIINPLNANDSSFYQAEFISNHDFKGVKYSSRFNFWLKKTLANKTNPNTKSR